VTQIVGQLTVCVERRWGWPGGRHWGRMGGSSGKAYPTEEQWPAVEKDAVAHLISVGLFCVQGSQGGARHRGATVML
jgi:hypothetical protein